MAPANPVATAAARSVNVGDILPATCELVSTFVGLSRTWANTIPSTTTKIGEVDWAKKLVSDILARDGSSGGAHLARASIHLAIGSLTQARKDLAQLSLRTPGPWHSRSAGRYSKQASNWWRQTGAKRCQHSQRHCRWPNPAGRYVPFSGTRRYCARPRHVRRALQ